MIAIIDYDAGNIKSVQKALLSLGEEVVLTRKPQEILQAEKVILPGVGSFGDAMQKLKEYNLIDVIYQVVEKKTPFLGICLGLQLMFESSQESEGVEGLGILKGKIVRIPDSLDESGKPRKIPHIGWNSLYFPKESRLFAGLPQESYVYFVHSFYLQAQEEDIVAATAEYGVTIHAAVEKDNVFACQFHPEKSSEVGLTILKNFVQIGRKAE